MSSHSPTKRSMGTLRPVLESIFPVFDGGNTATLARGQANMVFRVIFLFLDTQGKKFLDIQGKKYLFLDTQGKKKIG